MFTSRLRIGALALSLAAGVHAQERWLTGSAQSEVQAVVRRVVESVNNRDLNGILGAVDEHFDAFVPGLWVDRNEMKKLAAQPRPDMQRFELATLVRLLRPLTPDVAFGDGFYRTINLAGGESAGRVTLALVRRNGKWLLSAARFAPVRFDGKSYISAEPAPERTEPGPDGWIRLTSAAFASNDGGPLPNSWTLEDGTLRAVTGSGASGIRTRETFGSFELRFEWKLPPKGNSGVKYRLFYLSRRDGGGHEYQIVDDNGDPGAIKNTTERAGALYNQIAPTKQMAKPPGEFNESAIIVKGRHCEHWLNGEKVVEYETESGPLEGPILFQHHGTEAWYRNIRIKRQ